MTNCLREPDFDSIIEHYLARLYLRSGRTLKLEGPPADRVNYNLKMLLHMLSIEKRNVKQLYGI